MLKKILLYHLGLTISSIFPAIIVFFLANSVVWGFSVILIVNLFGFLKSSFFISISFFFLKPFGKFLGNEGFSAEEMVIALGTGKTTKLYKSRIKSDKILLLLPHCLQQHDCNRRITHNPYNCIRCGKCPIGSLLDVADRTGVEIAIATGGTLARRHIKAKRPVVVVAVACPRDLGQGMVDANPIPVIGVTNSRPNGDCIDTQVDIKEVERAIKNLLVDRN